VLASHKTPQQGRGGYRRLTAAVAAGRQVLAGASGHVTVCMRDTATSRNAYGLSVGPAMLTPLRGSRHVHALRSPSGHGSADWTLSPVAASRSNLRTGLYRVVVRTWSATDVGRQAIGRAYPRAISIEVCRRGYRSGLRVQGLAAGIHRYLGHMRTA